ncbi:MAG: glycosyltransferase family 4 protein [Caldilineaceae bacterium]
MRVLLIHQAFSSPGQAGGTRHFELGKYLVAAGDHFTVIASKLTYLTGKSSANALAIETVDGMRIIRSYTLPVRQRGITCRIISFLSFMLSSLWSGLWAGPFDLVVGTTPPIFQSVSAWLIAYIRRRPFVLEVRDLWPEFAIDMGVLRQPFLILLARGLESFLYARATHIVVNSPAYRTYLIGKGVTPSKITLVANGVTPEMFHPEARGEEVRRHLRLEGCFVATYAGALGVANDIPTVLRAAKHLAYHENIRFMLVGDGRERHRLEQYAAAEGLHNVIFTGAQPKNQMGKYLAASDVCIATLQNIPMFTTTYPNKVFDYMAAGRPTIVAIDGVIRDVIESANGGLFVPPGDDMALAQAVLALSTNQEAVARMGLSARNYVVQHFNRAEQGKQFVKLLHAIARDF